MPSLLLAACLSLAGPCSAAGDDNPDVPALLKKLKDAKPEARAEAAKELGELGPDAKGAVPALIEATRHADAKVRAHAVVALKAMGDEAKPAVPALIAATRDQDE